MLHQLLSILALCILAMAAFGLGRPILRGLGIAEEDRLSVAVWSIGVGLIAAGVLLLGLGLIGLLYVPVIGVMTLAGCFWGLGEILRGCVPEAGSLGNASSPHTDVADEAPWRPPARWLAWGIFTAAGIACLGSLIGALAPPTAGDALCYHLELPKRFLLEHGIVYLPYHDNATFPLLGEMWYLWALAMEGGVCAQLVHWSLGVFLALATVVLATPIVGRPWARIAGALVVLAPGVNNQMTAPLNDVALAALTTLALAGWWRAQASDGSRRPFVLAGLAAGGALGTKYLALVFAAAVAVTWIWALIRQPQRRRFLIEGAAVVAVVAVSVAGPWYARAAWHRGNPVFPFLSEVFSRADAADAEVRETLPESKSPLGRSPSGLASAPWLITVQPERFGGRAHQLGVLLLAAVPGVLFSRRLRGLGTLLGVAGSFFVLWYLLRQNVRFLFPIVPLLAVVTAWVWIEMRRFPTAPRWLAAATFAVVLAAMAAVPLQRAWGQLAVAAGLEDPGQYLLCHEPTYRAAAVANALLSPEDHILSQDYRTFYFNHRVTRESVYRRCTRYDQGITDPAKLSNRLRERGFTHLLLVETVAGKGIRYDRTLSRLADAQWATDAADALLPLDEYYYQDGEGLVRRYRLVMLQ